MKKILLFVLALAVIPVGVDAQSSRRDLGTLIQRGEQYLVPPTFEGFTGPVVSLHSIRLGSPGVIESWGSLREGFRHGLWEFYWITARVRQKGTYNKKHYFRYTVQGQSVNGNKYIEGDQINDLDLYSNNALVLTENVLISTMGSTPEVILFTNVGDVENSLSRNKNLIVDAKKAVVQHPIYADKSDKFHFSQLRIYNNSFYNLLLILLK